MGQHTKKINWANINSFEDYEFVRDIHRVNFSKKKYVNDAVTFDDIWEYTHSDYFDDIGHPIEPVFFDALNTFMTRRINSYVCICIMCQVKYKFGYYGYCLCCFFEKEQALIEIDLNDDIDKLKILMPKQKQQIDSNPLYDVELFLFNKLYSKYYLFTHVLHSIWSESGFEPCTESDPTTKGSDSLEFGSTLL